MGSSQLTVENLSRNAAPVPQIVRPAQPKGLGTGFARRTVERLRNKFLYRQLDAVLTSSLHAEKGRREHLRAVFSPISKCSDRIAAIMCLLDGVFPGTRKGAQRILLRPNSIPFPCDHIELLGAGSGSAVFLIEAAGERSVLKSYRRSIGSGRLSLLEMAAFYRNKFETVNSWYSGPHDIVAPAWFFIYRGLLLGRPVVGCLQRFVAGEMRDLLNDFSDQELVRMAEEDAAFRESLAFFAKRTLEIRSREGLCIDLLGTQNLIVVRERESWKLKLIDYGIFDFRHPGRNLFGISRASRSSGKRALPSRAAL